MKLWELLSACKSIQKPFTVVCWESNDSRHPSGANLSELVFCELGLHYAGDLHVAQLEKPVAGFVLNEEQNKLTFWLREEAEG